jgi:hypothetical protein
MRSLSLFVRVFVLICSFSLSKAAVGDAVCRYTSKTPAAVNYYICSQFADYYRITISKLFQVNPSLDPDCSNIKPNTEYCVAGCKS